MEWKFTPDQVVKCEVDYGLEEFRKDMFEEVRLNTGQMDDAQQQKIFNVMYDLCYWVATGNDYDDSLAALDEDPFFPTFLASIKAKLAPNREMLGAILQRLIMDRIEGQGMSLDDALKQVGELHRVTTAKRILN